MTMPMGCAGAGCGGGRTEAELLWRRHNPEALYNEANRKLAEKAMSTPSNPSGRRGSKHANLFTGLVYCAECGRG